MKTAYVTQREGVVLKLTITDKSAGTVVDVSSATVTLYCKDELDGSTDYQFQINDADVNKFQGASGILSFTLTATNLNFYGTKYCILKLDFSESGEEDNIRKIVFQIISTQSPE